MIKETISVDDTIVFLNELLAYDSEAIRDLILFGKVSCNEKMANHPTVQVGVIKNSNGLKSFSLGFLGLLNGLFGIHDLSGYGEIAALFDDENKLLKFERVNHQDVIDKIGLYEPEPSEIPKGQGK